MAVGGTMPPLPAGVSRETFKDLVKKKLVRMSIEMDDDSLVDYIVLITLDSGKDQTAILVDLEHFMAEDTPLFVRWMASFLSAGEVPDNAGGNAMTTDVGEDEFNDDDDDPPPGDPEPVESFIAQPARDGGGGRRCGEGRGYHDDRDRDRDRGDRGFDRHRDNEYNRDRRDNYRDRYEERSHRNEPPRRQRSRGTIDIPSNRLIQTAVKASISASGVAGSDKGAGSSIRSRLTSRTATRARESEGVESRLTKNIVSKSAQAAQMRSRGTIGRMRGDELGEERPRRQGKEVKSGQRFRLMDQALGSVKTGGRVTNGTREEAASRDDLRSFLNKSSAASSRGSKGGDKTVNKKPSIADRLTITAPKGVDKKQSVSSRFGMNPHAVPFVKQEYTNTHHRQAQPPRVKPPPAPVVTESPTDLTEAQKKRAEINRLKLLLAKKAKENAAAKARLAGGTPIPINDDPSPRLSKFTFSAAKTPAAIKTSGREPIGAAPTEITGAPTVESNAAMGAPSPRGRGRGRARGRGRGGGRGGRGGGANPYCYRRGSGEEATGTEDVAAHISERKFAAAEAPEGVPTDTGPDLTGFPTA